MKLVKKQGPFDPENPADLMDRVLRMKPRSFSDKEVQVYLARLQGPFPPPGAEEAVRILTDEMKRRKS